MPRKITLGSPKGGHSSVVVELGPDNTRFRFCPYDRALEDELTSLAKQIEEASDSSPADRVEIIAQQLDVMLEPAEGTVEDASAAALVTDAYNQEGSQLTLHDVIKLVEKVGKESRPT